jgi:thiamine-monophosphate kinase
MSENRRVRDVGEFGLIGILERSLPAEVREAHELELGIGDDAAIWQPSPGAKVAITTDSMVENVHFRRDWTDWERLGHKLLAVNLSDLAAMGARPKLAVITLGLRGDELVRDLVAMYRGIGALALAHGVAIAGGDIVRSPHDLMLHVAALGEVDGSPPLSRAGANPGDLIGVSGTIGASAAGLRLLALPEDDPRRGAATAEQLIEAHLRPQPRLALGAALRGHGASAAMDLSDGLFGDLPKLLAASGVSGRIDARRLPVASAVRALFPQEWLDLATRGGEDYELVFTAPPVAWAAIERAALEIGDRVSAIGEITPQDRRGPRLDVVDLDGTTRGMAPGAFDHFDAG